MGLYYSEAQDDLDELERNVAVSMEVLDETKQIDEELASAESYLGKIRSDVKDLHSKIDAIGKELEQRVLEINEDNLEAHSAWKTELSTLTDNAQSFVEEVTASYKVPFAGHVDKSEMSKMRENCMQLGKELIRMTDAVPVFQKYTYIESSPTVSSLKKSMGHIETDTNQKHGHSLSETCDEALGITGSENTASDSSDIMRFDYRSAQLWLTQGSLGSGSTEFKEPFDVAVGSNRNIYVTDSGNHRVKVYDSSFIALREFGYKGIRYDAFNDPSGICISDDELYVVDTNNKRVQVFSLGGDFLRTFGRFGPEGSKLTTPVGIAVGSNDMVYITDQSDDCIYVFKKNGNFVRCFGGKGSLPEQFNESPWHITVTKDGLVLVTDIGDKSKCRVYTTDGKYVKSFPKKRAVNYTCVSTDDNGFIFIYNCNTHSVEVFKQPGDFMCKFNTEGVIDSALGMAIDEEGNVIICDDKANSLNVFKAPLIQR